MHSIDWTEVLVFGVPAYIASILAGVAAIMSARNNRSLRTSNGHEIGELVESTHAAVNAGVATLDTINENNPKKDEGGTNV